MSANPVAPSGGAPDYAGTGEAAGFFKKLRTVSEGCAPRPTQ
jgi:hypothetical protein